MSRSLFPALLFLSPVVLAADVTVDPIGWRQNGGANVPEGQTSTVTAPLVVGDRATFVKSGAGTLEVPMAAFDRTAAHPTYAVLGGTLKITDEEVTSPVLETPACMQDAASWFSAVNDSSFVTSNATESVVHVQRWHDVRETSLDTPTLPYFEHELGTNTDRKATSPTFGQANFTNSAAAQQILTTFNGRRSVYFGGSAGSTAGGYMHLKSKTGAFFEHNIVYSVFFVHTVSGGLGSVFGSTPDPNDFFTVGYRGVGGGGYLYYRAESAGGTATGRAYRNGDAFDIFHEIIAARAETIGLDFTERPSRFGTLFNQRGRECVSGRFGGDYLSEIVAFTNRLSEAEIVEVNRYLMRKWNLAANTTNAVHIAIARGATVEFAPTKDLKFTNYYPVVFSGEGTIRQSGGRWLPLAGESIKNFRGALEIADNRLVTSRSDEFPPVVPVGGRQYTVTEVNRSSSLVDDTTRLVVSNVLQSSTTVEKKGEAELAFAVDRIPSSVRKFVVQEGKLTLKGMVSNDYFTVRTDTEGLNAVFANPGAELNQYTNGGPYKIESDKRLKLRSGTNPATIDGWTQPSTSKGTSGYVVLGGQAPTSTWRNGVPEGNQAIFILSAASNNVGEVYTTVTFPVAGEYLISWREARNYGGDTYGLIGYNLKFGKSADGWDAAPVIAKRTAATGAFPRVYQKVTVTEAGEYIFGFQLDSFHYTATGITYMGLVLDDFRGDFCPQNRSAAKIFKIPNGDFEETYQSSGIHGGTDISLLQETNVVSHWTFNQGENWPKSGDKHRSPAVGVAGYAFPRHNALYGSHNNQTLFARGADVKEGAHQLFICQGTSVGVGSYAETTFTVPKAGTYLLRGKASRWNVGYLDKDFLGNFDVRYYWPTVRATVTIGGAETILGDLPCRSHLQEDRVWTNAFTVAANTKVTLRLALTEHEYAALIDDLVLVDVTEFSFDDEMPEEILKNGSFEIGAVLRDNGDVNGTITDWTLVRGVKSGGGSGSMPGFYCNRGSTGQQYVKGAYDGDVVCNIRGTGEIYQKVSLAPGRYRFRIAGNTRFTNGYDKNGLLVCLYDEARTTVKKQIFATEGVTYNNPHVYETEFELTEGGTYCFSVKGDPHDVEHATGQERDNRCTAIDGLSLCRLSQTPRETPSLEDSLRVEVAAGAKLKLDFSGSVDVNRLKLGGTSIPVGTTVSATTYSDYIEGAGELKVTGAGAKGAVIIYK